jgi:hypothetical protein
VDVESDLVTTAATTLVEKLSGAAWQVAVSAIGNLWRRVHPERGDILEAEAVGSRTAALAARDAGDDQAMADVVGEWRSRLRRLIAEDARVADDLRQLLADLEPGGAAVDSTENGQISMRVKASGRSRVTLAGRDVHVTGS